jgi:hypothetical protein
MPFIRSQDRLGSATEYGVDGDVPVDLDDRLGKGLRRFLRQVVPDAALNHPVRVPAGELRASQ